MKTRSRRMHRTMSGHWNLREPNAEAFFEESDGSRWQPTGDLVTEQEGGVCHFHGRGDRMVKRRGNRVEPGEIQAARS